MTTDTISGTAAPTRRRPCRAGYHARPPTSCSVFPGPPPTQPAHGALAEICRPAPGGTSNGARRRGPRRLSSWPPPMRTRPRGLPMRRPGAAAVRLEDVPRIPDAATRGSGSGAGRSKRHKRLHEDLGAGESDNRRLSDPRHQRSSGRSAPKSFNQVRAPPSLPNSSTGSSSAWFAAAVGLLVAPPG